LDKLLNLVIYSLILPNYTLYLMKDNPKSITMKKSFYLFAIVLLLPLLNVYSQVGLGNTDPQAALDISASNLATPSSNDGILIPRMSAFPAINPGANQNSMVVYLSTNLTGVNISGTAKDYDVGFYSWDNTLTDWIRFNQKFAWNTDGNDDTINGTHFIRTTNAQDVDFRVNNTNRFRMTQSGQLETLTGSGSVYIGEDAGENDGPTLANTIHRNVFVGYEAGMANTEGIENIALGYQALKDNTTGNENIAIGSQTLENTTTGVSNYAIGNRAMRHNLTGSYCAALGGGALEFNQTGSSNTAFGVTALFLNVSGHNNSANGNQSLRNSTGSNNVGLGNRSGREMNSGNNNIFIGSFSDVSAAGFSERNTIIGSNAEVLPNTQSTVALGVYADVGDDYAIAIGSDASASGDSSIALGRDASTTNSNAVAIGNNATTTADNQIVLGNGAVSQVVTSGSYISGTTTYPDYVFEDYFDGFSTIKKDYKFISLEKAEGFVKKHGHLPGVKSYEEIKKNGFKLDITEAATKNLEKIEEQFLYITELNKSLKDKNSKIELQDEKIESLENRIERLEKFIASKD